MTFQIENRSNLAIKSKDASKTKSFHYAVNKCVSYLAN